MSAALVRTHLTSVAPSSLGQLTAVRGSLRQLTCIRSQHNIALSPLPEHAQVTSPSYLVLIGPLIVTVF